MQLCSWQSRCKPQNMRLWCGVGLQVPETSTWSPSLSQQAGAVTGGLGRDKFQPGFTLRGGRALV